MIKGSIGQSGIRRGEVAMFTKIRLVSPVYRVGRTKSGLLPELENISFLDANSAKKFLAQKLNGSVVKDCANAQSLQAFLAQGTPQCNVKVGEYDYWITKESNHANSNAKNR
jgi:hypothetical protein